MRTRVYVDGFNFYYGCVRGTPFKWLNFHELFRLLLPPNDVRAIKYFSARVEARGGDPSQATRQDTYFRALWLVKPAYSVHQAWLQGQGSPGPKKIGPDTDTPGQWTRGRAVGQPDGETLVVLTLDEGDLRKTGRGEILHVRALSSP